MNDLQELEEQLGPELRRVLDAIVPTDPAAFTESQLADPLRRRIAQPAVIEMHPHRPVAARPSRRLVAIAAATIAVVGLGGVIAIANRPADVAPGTPVRPDPTATAPQPADTEPLVASPTATSIAGPDDSTPLPDNVPGVYLPSIGLPGFTLTDVSASPAPPPLPNRNTTRYVRHDAAGDVDAMVTLAAGIAITDFEQRSNDRSITVHDQPAHIFDTGEGVVVAWEENGVSASVKGWGLSWDDLAALAERSVVDADPALVTIADLTDSGFSVSMDDVLPPLDAVMINLNYTSDEPIPGAFVDVLSWANTDSLSIDAIEADARQYGRAVKRTTVAGQPAIIATSTAGPLGPLVSVQWLRDGFFLVVSGRADVEDLLQLAESVQPATLSEARALRDDVDVALVTLPELDTATLPNGFQVSVRTTGTGANVLCLHEPIERCEPVISESSLIGEEQTEITATFHLDDGTWIIGWARGTHEPIRVNAGTDVGPIIDTAQGADGTFTALINSNDADQLKFDPDSQSLHGAISGGFDSDLLG